MSIRLNPNVPLPEPSREKHSLFATTASSTRNWLQTLPRANLGVVTRQLYQALAELNEVRCKGKDRLDVLEALRPEVHNALAGLSQHYLAKPLILPDNVEKIVVLANTLNRELAKGYSLAFRALAKESRLLRPTEALTICLHRMLSEESCILLRCYQLHRQPADGFWLELHQLFQHAVDQKLLRHTVQDTVGGSGTVTQTYLRALLLACSRPHQIPQRFLQELFLALIPLSKLLELRESSLEECAFLLKPDQDQPPQYRELEANPSTLGWQGLDTRELLKESNREQRAQALTALPLTLQEQLRMAWSGAAHRSAERLPCEVEAQLVIGLSACHYFVAHQLDFDAFKLDSEDAQLRPDPFAERGIEKVGDTGVDPWDVLSGANLKRHEASKKAQLNSAPVDDMETITYSLPQSTLKKPSSQSVFEYHQARLLDISAHGYRVSWPGTAELKVRNGEVVAIRSQDNPEWHLALIRWIRSEEASQSSQLGVEIVATSATPYSVRLLQSGLPTTDYQRGILLYGGSAELENTLLVSAMHTFKTGQTLELVRPGHAMRVKLAAVAEESNAFKIFHFTESKYNKGDSKQKGQSKDSAGPFNHVWDVL